MAVISCPSKYDCEGSDFPITNYSSEGPEQVPQFFSLYFPPSWEKPGCLSLCVSEISQNAADLCALAQEALCDTNPPAVFCSTATTCSCVHSDGSEFFYTTPAGTFCEATQEAADALAYAYACDSCRSPLTSSQIGAVTPCVCYGSSYSSQIIYGGLRPLAYLITDGSLPPGVSLNSSTGLISGTPTSTGVYSFTVRAFTIGGNYAMRSMSISVIAISTTAITDAVVGQAYSFQMQATGGSGNYAWSITSGALPPGLSMSATGLISGTPTVSETDLIEFRVTDTSCSSGVSSGCAKSLSITSNTSDPCGPLPAVSLLAYYKCDDVAYPFVDSVSGKDMTAVAGAPFPDVEPGIINTAFFGAAGIIPRAVGRNTDAQWELTGESAFTLRAWFWYSGTSSILYDTRVHSAGGRYGLIMFDPLLGPYFKFQVRGSAVYTHKHYAAIPGIGWHRVIGIFRKNCGSYLKIDNNATTFLADPIGLYAGSNYFEISFPSTAFDYPKTGIDEVGVWKGAWSEAQMLYDWNGGAGRSYPDVPA